MKIVSDSSVLITLEKVGLLNVLKKLYKEILIPPAVKKEVFRKRYVPKFIKCIKVSHPLALKVLESNLELGESEAICLYEELKADLLIIDDLEGRRLSERLGIEITGTLGILIVAKQKKLINNVKPVLDKFVDNGFRISDELYEEVLKKSHEF